METGFLLLNWLIARVIKWPQFIIFFQAAFCIGVTLRFIYKYSEDVLLSVLGFMSFGLMQFYLTGFRQSFAIAICLIALEFAFKKKFMGFILSVIIAASIHQTAIVFIPVYWIVKIGLTKLYALVDLIAILILSQIVPRIISLGNEVFDREYQNILEGNNLGGMINILIGTGVLVVMFYQSDRYKNFEISGKGITNSIQPLSGFFHLTTIGIGIYALRYQAQVLERISLYFTPSLFILLPHVINNSFTEDSKKILKPLFVVAMIFLAWWRLHNFGYEVFW
jgi:transmembrane protein EpsG